VETGLPLNDLLDAPDGVLEAVFAYIKERAKAREK
jgi:hypothetical protein